MKNCQCVALRGHRSGPDTADPINIMSHHGTQRVVVGVVHVRERDVVEVVRVLRSRQRVQDNVVHLAPPAPSVRCIEQG